MNDKALYWAAMIFGGLALLLVVSNVFLINGNRNFQIELNQRQVAINNNGNLDQLNKALIQALAQDSVENDDKDARELLASQGFTVKAKGDKASAAPSEEKSEKSEKRK